MSTEGEFVKNKLLFVKHKFSEALWYGWNVDTAKKKQRTIYQRCYNPGEKKKSINWQLLWSVMREV